jgi:hypothetical protein
MHSPRATHPCSARPVSSFTPTIPLISETPTPETKQIQFIQYLKLNRTGRQRKWGFHKEAMSIAPIESAAILSSRVQHLQAQLRQGFRVDATSAQD